MTSNNPRPRYRNPRDAGSTLPQSLDQLRAMVETSLVEPVEVWLVNFRGGGTGQLCIASPGLKRPVRYLGNLDEEDRAAVIGWRVVGTINPRKGTINA